MTQKIHLLPSVMYRHLIFIKLLKNLLRILSNGTPDDLTLSTIVVFIFFDSSICYMNVHRPDPEPIQH
uniref:Uncharacterized protein n=1 Tax=Romanomermis culicivorax TaxID=13658 RepID=A0A915IJS3_ROMCU